MNDLRFALRQLRKSPGFTVVAVMTLALGIGANTAIFSVVHAVLLQPLPYPDAGRIVTLNESNGGTNMSIAFLDYLDWRRDNTVFEHLAISRRESRNLSAIPGRESERVGVAFVTANFFNVIGVSPQLGRTFTEEEDHLGGPQLAVISDQLWQRVFQRDPGVVGRAVTFHDQLVTVVGVMPPSVTSPQETDAWFPIMRRSGGWQNRAAHPMIFGWGKLKAGVTVQQARAEMKGIAARIAKDYPATSEGVGAVVTPLLDNLVGDYRKNLALLLGAVGFVLLIACANLANLFAARGAARAREFAIRAAVGASRGKIIRQLLIESATIAALGGAFGFLFALWSRDALAALAPQGIPRFHDLHFDARVLWFTFALAGLTSLLFGLWPAWRTSRADVQLALQSGARGSSDSRSARRSRDWLVIAEIALTLILLSSAGLVIKSFARAQSVALGFEPDGLLTSRIELPFTRYTDAEKASAFSRALMEKTRAIPGVESVGIGSNPPLVSGWQISFQREGTSLPEAQRPAAECEVVGGDYFGALKTPMLRGRTFNEHDAGKAPLVTVIDQTMAEQFFPGEDPIGKRLSMAPFSQTDGNEWFEIVGVVGRMKFHGFDDPAPLPVVYFSHAQVDRTALVLLVRAGARMKALEKPVRDMVAAVDPTQPVFDVRPMSARVQETWATQRLLTFLLSIFAGLAFLLASIGLYGVIAYTAIGRLREIGVRLALGAQRGDIRALILSHGLRLLSIGLALGIAGALAGSRLLRSFLFDVGTIDPVIYLGVTLLFSVAALIACWLPARRAARVDPIITLRAE